jgi:hypothetical protein
MPREVTAYLCDHRCGRQASTVLKSVEAHEATCFLNPARRSCKTCEHESTEDDDGYSAPYRICMAPATQHGEDPAYDALDEFNAALENQNRIAVNCKYWEPSKSRYPDGAEVPPWEPLREPEHAQDSSWRPSWATSGAGAAAACTGIGSALRGRAGRAECWSRPRRQASPAPSGPRSIPRPCVAFRLH